MKMNATRYYFGIPRTATFDTNGVSTVKVNTTDYEKLRFTALLTAGVQSCIGGTFKPFLLPSLAIFKNLKKSPASTFPPGIVVLGTKGGTMSKDIMTKDLDDGYFQTVKSTLLIDSAKSHLVTKLEPR